jgi:hypothetical protein
LLVEVILIANVAEYTEWNNVVNVKRASFLLDFAATLATVGATVIVLVSTELPGFARELVAAVMASDSNNGGHKKHLLLALTAHLSRAHRCQQEAKRIISIALQTVNNGCALDISIIPQEAHFV